MEKTILNRAFPFFLFISPIFYFAIGGNLDIREQQFWLVLVACAFFVAVTQFNKIIGFALLYCLAHLALFQHPAYLNSLVQITAHLVIYNVVARYYKGNGYKWPILAVLVLNLVMSGLQYFKQDVFLHIDLQTAGLMTLPVYIGIYAAITAPIIYSIHPALIILSILGIAVSKSSFSALAFALGVGFYLFKTNRRIFKFFASAGLICLIYFIGFYDGPTGQFSRRVHIWKMVGSAIAINPFGGWGIGSYDHYIRFAEIGNKKESREYVTFQPSKIEHIAKLDDKIYQVAKKEIGEDKATELFNAQSTREMTDWLRKNGSDFYVWQDPHNQFLLAWFEGGLPLLFLILWYCWDIGKRFLYCAPMKDYFKHTIPLFSCFIALFIVSLAHFPFGVARISFTAVVLLAILDSKLKKEDNLESEWL